jgi:hypothetical protein
MDWNLYFDARAQAAPITFSGASLEDWRKRGHDVNSAAADPQFATKNSYELKPGSPAFKLGFKPINLTGVGPR